jgi:hypothetical protein
MASWLERGDWSPLAKAVTGHRTPKLVQQTIMKRVTGIGGVFFKAKDPEKLRTWYQEHLGLEFDAYGSVVFDCPESDDQRKGAHCRDWRKVASL